MTEYINRHAYLAKADNIIIDSRHLLWRVCSVVWTADGKPQLNPDILKMSVETFFSHIMKAAEYYTRPLSHGLIVLAWEGKHSWQYHRNIYPQYKQGRGKHDEKDQPLFDLINEAEYEVRSLAGQFGWLQVQPVDGYEADDSMPTICNILEGSIHILSGDHDLWQLIDKWNVRVLQPTRGGKHGYTVVDELQCSGITGVWPKQIPLWKAIGGDSSDNIPGLRSIGPKRSWHLIAKCGGNVTTPTQLFAAIDEQLSGWTDKQVIKTARLATENQSDINTFYKLTKICGVAIKATHKPKGRIQHPWRTAQSYGSKILAKHASDLHKWSYYE